MTHTSYCSLVLASLSCLALVTLTSSEAHAGGDVEASVSRSWTPSVGARIGGYGFRQLNEDNTLIDWEQCRMNGVGMFAGIDFASKAYTELSLDIYHATAEPMTKGLDRVSVHSHALVGFRMPVTSWLVPHVHIGGGAEFTRVDVRGVEDQAIKPVAFAGLGGELVLKKFRFGTTVRSNVMQLPEYDWHTVNDSTELSYKTELAAQMVFFVRYEL